MNNFFRSAFYASPRKVLSGIGANGKIMKIISCEKFTVQAETPFQRYRIALTKLKKKANSFYVKKAAAARNDVSKTWSLISQMITHKKKKRGKFNLKTGIANLLNCHFSSIADKIPKNVGDPLSYMRQNVVAMFHLTPTAANQILKLIDDLDEKKSTGSDSI